MSEAQPQNERGPLNKEERRKMESLREPALAIMETLGPMLENKEVAGIIALDASGRVPGRLISEITRRIQGKGVPTHFLPTLKPQLTEKIQRMRLPKDGIVLLVDDTYASGTSLNPIEAELRALGYTVRVIAFYDSERTLLRKHPDALYGIQGTDSDIYNTPTLSGVQNKREAFATVVRSSKGIPAKRFRGKIAASRNILTTMADEIVTEYRSEKK